MLILLKQLQNVKKNENSRISNSSSSSLDSNHKNRELEKRKLGNTNSPETAAKIPKKEGNYFFRIIQKSLTMLCNNRNLICS